MKDEITEEDVYKALATFPQRFISARVHKPSETAKRMVRQSMVGRLEGVDVLRTSDGAQFVPVDNGDDVDWGFLDYYVDVHGTNSRLGLFKTMRNATTVPDHWDGHKNSRRSRRITLLLDLTKLPIVQVDDGVKYAVDTDKDELQLAERQIELWSLRAAALRSKGK